MTGAQSSLAEALDTTLPEEREREGWHVTDLAGAEWAVRKVAHIDRELAEREKLAREEIERINTWLNAERKRLLTEREYFVSKLAEFHSVVIKEDPKRKTIKLPHGELQIRKQQPEYVRDDLKLLDWVLANRPEFVEQRPFLLWADLKAKTAVVSSDPLHPKLVDQETGEVVQGVTVILRPDKFEVKTSGEGQA